MEPSDPAVDAYWLAARKRVGPTRFADAAHMTQ